MVNRRRKVNIASESTGLTLLELVIALGLTALLVAGLVKIASAGSSSTRLQRNQAEIQENARLTVTTLSGIVREAGFSPEPWNDAFVLPGLGEESVDAVTAKSDRLVIRSWSDLNCFHNRNPVLDSAGNTRFFIREFAFDLNSTNGLTKQCRFGPSLDNMTTQIRRQGFIEGVESFQVVYGLDSDRDGAAEAWVSRGNWSNPHLIRGVKLGLLLAGPDSVVAAEKNNFLVLDTVAYSPADGKLRRVIIFTAMFRGNQG